MSDDLLPILKSWTVADCETLPFKSWQLTRAAAERLEATEKRIATLERELAGAEKWRALLVEVVSTTNAARGCLTRSAADWDRIEAWQKAEKAIRALKEPTDAG